MDMVGVDQLTRISRLVCAGVYARMCGEDYTVMTLAGSGNKGITVSVPITLFGREAGLPRERIEEALAVACVLTSQTTRRLGTLSAVCGCSNAAGIGLARPRSEPPHLQPRLQLLPDFGLGGARSERQQQHRSCQQAHHHGCQPQPGYQRLAIM